MTTTLCGSFGRGALAAFILMILAACGGGGGGGDGSRTPPPDTNPTPTPPTTPPPGVAATSPFVPGAPYAGVLRRCTYAGDATEQCALGTLPFLGMEVSSPTIADVLSRTLVSHDWMGANFERVLARLPDDLLPLFRSVTAVVIASDIRPAHYDPESGAIYLDPEYLWLTVAERDTVSTEPDPRSGFGLDLAFEMPWRFVRNNQPLTVYINADGSRDPPQIEEIMAYLLYHELAHAVDFVPPARFGVIQDSQTVLDVLDQYPPLSIAFQSAMPLTSQRLEDLAAVSFLGEDSTAQQRALQPDDLVMDFANDGATQYYAYTSRFEDFALLFDSAMMKWHYGYDKDTAITNRPASGGTDAAIIAWGTRGRLGEQIVQARVRAVGEHIYPGDLSAFEAFLNSEPEPTLMTPGDTWGDSLILPSAPGAVAAASASTEGVSNRRADYLLERVPIR